MDQPVAYIEKEGRSWFVVVPQQQGNILKFLCDSERDAEHFLKVFIPGPKLRRGPVASGTEPGR